MGALGLFSRADLADLAPLSSAWQAVMAGQAFSAGGGELLAGRLRDDLLRHVRGNLGVGVELHAVTGPALRLRPQVADVAEHLRQRHESAYDAGAAALLHRLD